MSETAADTTLKVGDELLVDEAFLGRHNRGLWKGVKVAYVGAIDTSKRFPTVLVTSNRRSPYVFGTESIESALDMRRAYLEANS